MKMKRFWQWPILVLGIFCLVLTAYGSHEAKSISDKVLTGPNELNPEKILGPGGIGIVTHKNILMSFWATVRIIPTFENNNDFGMSDNVPRYVGTTGVKTFAQSTLNKANAGLEVYQTGTALKNALDNNRGIRGAFDDFATSLYLADEVIGGSPTTPAETRAKLEAASAGAAQLKAAADAAYIITSVQTAQIYMTATTVATETKAAYQAGIAAGQAASAEYQAAIAARDTTIAGAALQAISGDTDYRAAIAAGDLAVAQTRATAVATPFVLKYALAAADSTTQGSGAVLQAIVTNLAYQAAIAAGDTAGAQAAASASAVPVITAASVTAAEAAAPGGGAAIQAILADPAYQAASVSGDADAATAAAQAVIIQAVAATADKVASALIADQSAALTAEADTIVSYVAATIMSNPNTTPANITDAVAYATMLKATADGFQPDGILSNIFRFLKIVQNWFIRLMSTSEYINSSIQPVTSLILA